MANYTAFHPNPTIATRWHMSIHIFAILSIIVQQYCILLQTQNNSYFLSL
jgi:hypothetical protein